MTTLLNSKILQIIHLLLFVVVLCPFADGKVIYVDDDAIGANDGTSWENAYIYLQDALADAKVAEKPVEIRIAQGIYKPDQGTGLTPGDRGATFKLLNDVKLMDGYAGLEQYDPNARDIELYRTILSGDLDGNDVDVNAPRDLLNEPTRAENSYHVVSGNGADETAVLNGLTITAGNTKGSNQYSYGVGGGMYNHRGEPNLINCTFNDNFALHYGGGGVYNYDSFASFNNCEFSGNSIAKSFYGGAGMCNVESSPTLSNCVFIGNWAADPDYSSAGGGMFNESSSPILNNCMFSDNSARKGGAIGNESSSPSFFNCIFSGNRGIWGGGIHSSESQPTLINCTFALNSALLGNAITCDSEPYNRPSFIRLFNCIVWDGGNEIWNNDTSIFTIVYNDIWDGFPGEGNINVEPLFADPGSRDFHLKSEVGRWDPVSQSWVLDDVNSPCIDVGEPNMPVGDEPEPNGGIINMGAYGGTPEASKSISTVNSRF